MLTSVRRRRTAEDEGFTLVEMIVAMGIFSIVLAVFGAGIVSMTHTTARVQATGETTNEARQAFNLLDKQVRYASALNAPARVGDTWYVEFLTDATGVTGAVENPSQCHQWRLRSSTDTLELRSWDIGGAPTAWRAVAHYVVNDPVADVPFVFSPAGTNSTRQGLAVSLSLQRGEAPVGELTSNFVARNSSTSAVTNLDSDGNGVNDRVCTGQGQP